MSSDENGPRTATGCAPCSPNTRNNYFRGKLMTVADYQVEQGYMIARRRVVNRLLLGWGIISGFKVDVGKGGLVIGVGQALDPCGREVIACEEVVIKGEDDLIWLEPGKCGLEPGKAAEMAPQDEPAAAQDDHCDDDADEPAEPAPQGYEGDPEGGQPAGTNDKHPCPRFLLCAHYGERHVDGVRVSIACDESICEPNRICETVVYSLRPAVEHGLPFLVTEDCSTFEPAPGPAPLPTEQPYVVPADDRGQAGLCLHDPDEWCDRRFDPCCVPKLCRIGDLFVDFDAGIPLAYVDFTRDACGRLEFIGIFDIIRGCALTRIQDVGWRDWLGYPTSRIAYSTFAEMFVEPPPPDYAGQKPKVPKALKPERPPVDTHFSVCFSGPVQVASLSPDVMTMTLIQRERSEDVGAMTRVPITHLCIAPPEDTDPAGTTRRIRPMVSCRFWDGEINPENSSAFDRPTLVEIEIRADFIVDWFGREVAGGGRFVPSSGVTPGGRFLSSILVVPDDECDTGASSAPQGESAQPIANKANKEG